MLLVKGYSRSLLPMNESTIGLIKFAGNGCAIFEDENSSPASGNVSTGSPGCEESWVYVK